MTTETLQQRIARLEEMKQKVLAAYDEHGEYHNADRIKAIRTIESHLASAWELERQRRATSTI